jgi:hypothetical protein
LHCSSGGSSPPCAARRGARLARANIWSRARSQDDPSVLAIIATPDERGALMAIFNDRMVPETVQRFWAALQRGEFITDAAAEVGTYHKKGTRWVAACGGVRPRRGRGLKGRCLSFSEREEIALSSARGERCAASRGG